MNVWISHKGLQEDKFKFPYTARGLSKRREFKDINDVEDELLAVYYDAEKQGYSSIGECLHLEHLYFCNSSLLVDAHYQAMIRSYVYCQSSKTPPFKSLAETPADFVDQWMLIENEINYIRNQEVREHGNK